ncbi:Extracellular calcium-sensing receptor [Liparis tanakae]|uniref:Extracellular calcium-sensing receptor n=1 Tax=Liparis tanakae TaxID=230148 RepID=A0A4Z2FIC7_9TELE|nr:Extracellular calcium-sensing receptor [Liparis tanakae]
MASPWLILWALFSLLFSVLSDGKETEEPSSEKSGVGNKEAVIDVVSSLPHCVKLAADEPLAQQSGGDVVIGGLFPLHYVAPKQYGSYQSKPHLTLCRSFDYRAFRWIMTMVFAVEEINRNLSLLPGVKLGYRIMDSCEHVHTSLNALLSLVTPSRAVMNVVNQMEEIEKRLDMSKDRTTRSDAVKGKQNKRKERILSTVKKRGFAILGAMPHSLGNNGNDQKENKTGETIDRSTQSQNVPSCLADSPVPAVIGLASSSPTRAVAQTLGPLNLPLVRIK